MFVGIKDIAVIYNMFVYTYVCAYIYLCMCRHKCKYDMYINMYTVLAKAKSQRSTFFDVSVFLKTKGSDVKTFFNLLLSEWIILYNLIAYTKSFYNWFRTSKKTLGAIVVLANTVCTFADTYICIYELPQYAYANVFN